MSLFQIVVMQGGRPPKASPADASGALPQLVADWARTAPAFVAKRAAAVAADIVKAPTARR